MELQRSPGKQTPPSSRRRFWQRIKRFRQSKLSTPSVIGPLNYPQCFPAEIHDDDAIREQEQPDEPQLPTADSPVLETPKSPQPAGQPMLYRLLTSLLSCHTDLPSIAELSCCSPDTTTTNDSFRNTSEAAGDEIEVTPNHRVTVSSKNKDVLRSPGPHIQLGTFESFVSDLSWESTILELPPPMAYYALSNLSMEEVYPRRCFFTGVKIAKNGLYYAGCVVQRRRTLVVFCHASALPAGDLDIASRLSTKYSLAGLSNLTVWQSYNTVCHWSGLPIHTDRDVHHRWKCGSVCLYLAEVVVEFLSLDELQALPGRYEAKTPSLVLDSLEFWETIDPSTNRSSTKLI